MTVPLVKLITFGGGSAEYRNAATRLIIQSQDFFAINERKAYTDLDLPPDYYEIFNELNKNYKIGYGLYSWKPFLIYKELCELKPNDILIYLDAGCELNKHGIQRFNYYLSYTSKNDILVFELLHPNRFWTKNHAKLIYSEHYFRNQIAATVIFLKNSEITQQFVKLWLELCIYENSILLKEPKNSDVQIPEFINHRHDQSCLSTCVYLYNINPLPDETWFSNWSHGKNYPILALRNRTGSSILNKKIQRNLLKDIALLFQKIINFFGGRINF